MQTEKQIRTAAAGIMNEVLNTIEPGKTPREVIDNAIKNAQHELTALLNMTGTLNEMPPELEKDLVSAISKLIHIRYNLNRISNFRPCKFQN